MRRSSSVNRRASILSFWLPSLMEVFFRGSHTTNFVTCDFTKSYNQAAEVPSSNVTRKSPRSPSINCRIMLALVSIMHSITIFPAPFITAWTRQRIRFPDMVQQALVLKACGTFPVMRHADIRNTISAHEPNMDESKRQAHCKLVCLVCGNNSWIDLMLRLPAGRGKIEPWEATLHLESASY